jgi:hypothetical protein
MAPFSEGCSLDATVDRERCDVEDVTGKVSCEANVGTPGEVAQMGASTIVLEA